MSLASGFSVTYEGIKLIGYSVAGITTSIAMPDAEVCFDVGQGLPYQIPIPNILLTHGHMDHASGIPYLIAMKNMTSQPVPDIYMPESLVEHMKELMKIWAKIDQHTYRFNFIPVVPGQTVQLKPPYFFRPFRTIHRVDSQGYTIYEKKKRLKDEYKDLPPRELGLLRKQGHILDDYSEEPVLSFTGDTKIEFLESEDVRKSRVLVMEVTYWDKKKTVANAREWGHIHFDELLERIETLECRKVVLIHASARYNTAYLEQILAARVPEHLRDRFTLFPRPM
jgi:ribonuclease Z